MQKKFFYPADILLPKDNFTEWSVIACDQYTSQPDYWAEVKNTVGDKPSAYNIILPEAYLSDDDSEKIKAINAIMKDYLEKDVFNVYENTMIYCERTLKDGKKRLGIVGLIDLEDYSYIKGADTPIRATEETVIERIPPRVNIRKDALVEMPHIMLLIDDADRTVIEPIAKKSIELEKLYDFQLMQNSGSIKGYKLGADDIVSVQDALAELYNKSEDGLLFAMGDGNHSLASAKECYRQGIGPRYALVEVVNIHDTSLEFEPIYRVLFGVNPETVIGDFLDYCGGEYYGEDAQEFICCFGDTEKTVSVKPKGSLPIATLQTFLDEYMKGNYNIKLDYIHGIESTKKLADSANTLGFIFNGMTKSELFTAVSKDGSLPRKTFSMGCADDKRFYLEARKIK
ncbi:MAG: DUF1015 domain-containing protein [Clostridia bacterium]|nr:DUF1015 domain-containing protein [Clostridia bacterium]